MEEIFLNLFVALVFFFRTLSLLAKERVFQIYPGKSFFAASLMALYLVAVFFYILPLTLERLHINYFSDEKYLVILITLLFMTPLYLLYRLFKNWLSRGKTSN